MLVKVATEPSCLWIHHPQVVLLPVASPVVSRVTEHQHVAGQPVGAAVASLRGYGADLGPPGQVHLQPLVPV